MTRIIMVEFDALTRSEWIKLYDLAQDIDMALIVVGKGLQHDEGVARLKSENPIWRIIRQPCYFTNTFKLRQSFIKYFSKTHRYDFDKMACVTKAKADVKNNIVVNKNVFERILKFYSLARASEPCRECRGHGIIEHYDQCGCPEWESSCNKCGGTGKISFFEENE